MIWSTNWPMNGVNILSESVKAVLTFECDCGEELDINTYSFSKLMDAAKRQNWLVKFNDIGYSVYCPQCRK